MANFSAIMNFLKLEVLVLVVSLISLAEGSVPPKSKRQIYREQVLPSKGGKIPDEAFRTDRLALNRLNKEGIAIPDGVLLEHRHVHSHPHINAHDPEDEDSLIKIIQRPEDRYVAPVGKLHNKKPLTVSSTYIIRKPIGPESTAIRTPLDQVPYHETLNQHQGNQIYQVYPDNYHQQQYSHNYASPQLPQKYLPAQLTAPPQKYIPVESPPQKYIPIESPPQKYVPLKSPSQNYLPVEISAPTQKYLPVESPPQKYLPVDISTSSQKYLSPDLSAPPSAELPGPTTNVIHHPHPYGYSAPVSYQQIHQSVAYYPIHVPLELPNKDTLKDGYYSVKSQGNTYGSHRDSEDIHSVVNWPYLLKQYTRLSDKINVLDHDSYGQPAPHSLFFTPEVLGSIDSGSRYYATRDRYARKSKEIAFTDSTPEANEKFRLKGSRRLIKLKCTSRLENTVEDGSAQCFIRY